MEQKNVFWLEAKNKRIFNANFIALAETLGVDLNKVKECLSERGYLLVFDGVKDASILSEFLSPTSCHILITSRKKDWNTAVSQVEVGPFSLDEAIEFLVYNTGKDDREAAQKIALALDCLPTSLDDAAKLIITSQTELNGYFALRDDLLDTHAKKLKEISNLSGRNKNFIGREINLANLEDALKTRSSVIISSKRRLAAETGLGGVGKTQIALQYAYRNADKYPGLIWWVNAAREETILDSYLNLVDKLGILLTTEEKKDKNSWVKRVLRKLEESAKYLLIFDNAEDQELIKPYLPQSGGHILITSRHANWDLNKTHVFEVGLFKRSESIALIKKMTTLNDQEADSIAALVQDLPLAVAQAAAYIQQTKITPEQYIQRFNEKSQKLFGYQQPTDEFSRTVNIAWEISMEKINEREKERSETLKTPYPIAIPLMDLCAYFDSRDIPLSILLSWAKQNYQESVQANLYSTLELLQDFSMIQWDEKGISIHPLVQLVANTKQTSEKREELLQKGLEVLNNSYTYKPKTYLEINANRTLFSHGKSVLAHIRRRKKSNRLF